MITTGNWLDLEINTSFLPDDFMYDQETAKLKHGLVIAQSFSYVKVNTSKKDMYLR